VLDDPALVAEYKAYWEHRQVASERYRGALPPTKTMEIE
jgi:hypothetical protein